ncbi:MAG: hypothetical protein K0R92_268 [Lachnospiraceae bacterium]|jgi:uncharacterized membrane protein YesL|nr:hypothetical protein [Lachnospiraceae bacterium]MDF2802358.1 hypothetical protein [Anaerocolumna sp.]
MSNFFNLDNGVFAFLGKLWDVIMLGIIYAIICIPIITIGPATTALYYTTVKVIRRERGYLMKEFFHSFKMNFKSGLIVSIILGIFYIIMYADRTFAKNLGGTYGYLLMAFFNAIAFIIIGVTIYIFPVLSRFKMNIRELYKTAFFMTIKHLPTTLLLMIMIGLFAFMCYIFNLLIIFTPGILALSCSFLLERIFKKYMPSRTEEEGSAPLDEWYLE